MRKRTKYKSKFDTIVINNRWKRPYYSRGDSWVYFGFSKRYFSTNDYEYVISLFGIDIRIWMTREPAK